MFDMSWGEVLIIGAVALIVIGPKDLPRTLRAVGNAVGKIKRMAGEFQTQFNDAMREAELDQVRKEFESVNRAANTTFNPIQTIRDEVKGAIEKQPGSSASAAAATAAAYAGSQVASPDAAPAAQVDIPPPELPQPAAPTFDPPKPPATDTASPVPAPHDGKTT